MQQQYSNHRRYYAPHHFVFIPLMCALCAYGSVKAYKTEEGQQVQWLILAVLSFCILYIGTLLRQHYALGNQNRIVRLEFRLRYFELFGKRSKEVEGQLSFSQIAALRFASDEEFAGLLERTLNEKLTADQIKRAVTNWQADHMRL